ncbi:MAG: CDP-alcohol phosphatidyltransferase family protein, partial [Clostridia bacterium]
YFLNHNIVVAATLIVFSGLTDMLDGLIARKFNQITELGKMLDPFADKLTQIAIAICVAINFPILFPFLAIMLAKELAMIFFATLLLKSKKRPSAAKWYGKLGTVMFYLSVTVIIVMHISKVSIDIFLPVSIVLLSITVFVMVYSSVQYFKIYKEIKTSESQTVSINDDKK